MKTGLKLPFWQNSEKAGSQPVRRCVQCLRINGGCHSTDRKKFSGYKKTAEIRGLSQSVLLDDQEVQKYEQAEHDTVPAEDLEVMFLDVLHQELDDDDG